MELDDGVKKDKSKDLLDDFFDTVQYQEDGEVYEREEASDEGSED